MRLWLEFLVIGVLVWAVSLPGTDPAIRVAVLAVALGWSTVRATRSQRN